MIITNWLSDNYIEVFGAITGIIYVFLEIRQSIWLWPVGIITSAVYIWVFFTGKLYADMSLQGYYLVISVLGWYWWVMGTWRRAQGTGQRKEREKGRKGEGEKRGGGDLESEYRLPNTDYRLPITEDKAGLIVSRLKRKTGLILGLVFVMLYVIMWFILSRFTDSPVPGWDSFLTSLSIVATWMLARKIYEHWFLWIVVNSVAAVLFLTRGLYPTALLYSVYCIMSFAGLVAWEKTIINDSLISENEN